jgi:hypothetical protein
MLTKLLCRCGGSFFGLKSVGNMYSHGGEGVGVGEG